MPARRNPRERGSAGLPAGAGRGPSPAPTAGHRRLTGRRRRTARSLSSMAF